MWTPFQAKSTQKPYRASYSLPWIRLLIATAVLCFRDFMLCCGKALELNDELIKEDQRMYQEDLKEKYANMKLELANYLDGEVGI